MDNTLESRMKPCQRCGSEVRVYKVDPYGTGAKFAVGCTNPDCVIQPSTPWFQTEDEAVRNWQEVGHA